MSLVPSSGESESIRVPQSNVRGAEFRSEKIGARRKRKFFRVVAKHAFPRQTAPELRVLAGAGERTVYDWLAGNSDAPSAVLMVLLGRIAQRELAAD